ncbi:type VII secretion target [Streptomyces achromogenes]|uniref:type VII secretion target n=1 Tax=Streptomyces achromogenes TaxID=67255 RepID=UPI003677215B
MGASTDGYTVRSGMAGQATELDGAGDDAGHVAEAVRPAGNQSADTLGGAESAAAFDAFAAAWEAEATTLESALRELAGKVRAAKGAYGGADHTVATRAAAVPGGGPTTMPTPAGGGTVTTMPTPAGPGAVTTMPTPAGGGAVTTMPVHAERPSALSRY